MIVLASASPRRRALLEAAGLGFEVDPADIDEACTEESPEAHALFLAEEKARTVARRYTGHEAWILGADTLVTVPEEERGVGESPTWRILGKPADAAEARVMLRLLSDTRHRVVTGVCVVDARDGASSSRAESTWVRMRHIEPEEIEAYVDSGEWRDKAGGYAIQENADVFVTELAGGGFDNVVGLPVRLTLELLAAHGAPVPASRG